VQSVQQLPGHVGVGVGVLVQVKRHLIRHLQHPRKARQGRAGQGRTGQGRQSSKAGIEEKKERKAGGRWIYLHFVADDGYEPIEDYTAQTHMKHRATLIDCRGEREEDRRADKHKEGGDL